jgi:hypothetical protein
LIQQAKSLSGSSGGFAIVCELRCLADPRAEAVARIGLLTERDDPDRAIRLLQRTTD